MKLVSSPQHLNKVVLTDLLSVIGKHKLSVGGALAHLLGLAAGIGKCYQWGVGNDEQAAEAFTTNAQAAWKACPKDLIAGDTKGEKQ